MRIRIKYLRFIYRISLVFGRVVLRLGNFLMAWDGFNISLSNKLNTYIKNKMMDELKK